jgi:ABC-type bacteriocin/lantibiotic exporter with double-glycine peptidase domain
MGRLLFTLLATMLFSEEDLRFTHIYKQGYDTSCGVAVTASLLNTYWHIPISEADLYQDLILDQAQEEAATYTVSMRAIGEYLKTQGIQSRAYKMDWETLEDSLSKGYGPILIHYEKPDPHFALLVHVEGWYGFVGDPARGFVLVDKGEFMKHYSGNVLLTASREASKDTGAVEGVIARGRERLTRLQGLARRRRHQ